MPVAPSSASGVRNRSFARRVLFVDDEAMMVHAMEGALRRCGFGAVATARDGEEALALHSAEPFDVILTNYMMPRCDGIELLGALRSRGDRVPVIMHSARARREVEVRCAGLDLHHFFQSPFVCEEYVAVVHDVLRTRLGRAATGADAPPTRSG